MSPTTWIGQCREVRGLGESVYACKTVKRGSGCRFSWGQRRKFGWAIWVGLFSGCLPFMHGIGIEDGFTWTNHICTMDRCVGHAGLSETHESQDVCYCMTMCAGENPMSLHMEHITVLIKITMFT